MTAPYYILHSCSSLSAPSATLGHPTIQYHYSDDSPLALLPRSQDEHVLLLEFDPSSATARSISDNIAVTGLRVAEAPGALAEDDTKNTGMYILETTTITDKSSPDASPEDRETPQAILAQFKHRNTVLRRTLLYPDK